MKSKIKIGLLITSVIVFASSILIGGYVFYTLRSFTENGTEIIANGSEEPIHINGHSDWVNAKAAGICTGNGTISDPYIIEDLEINANGLGGILIENSTVYFKIENCTIYDAGWSYGGWFCYPDESGAIALLNVSNAKINNNTCINSTYGIYVDGNNNTIFRNTVSENNWMGVGLSGIYNNISENTINNNVYGIRLSGSNNVISGNTVNNNEYEGIDISGFIDTSVTCLSYLQCYNNTISGNTITNNGIGIRLESANNNTISGNFLKGNYECIVEDGFGNMFVDNQCEKGKLYAIPGWHPVFIVGILYGVCLTFLGIVSAVSISQNKKENIRERKMKSQFKFEERLTDIKPKNKVETKALDISQGILEDERLQIKTKSLSVNQEKEKLFDINQEKILQGKTLQVYWYILSHRRAGVREIQKSLNFSSPGTASYQIKKLSEAGIISKDDKTEKYYVNKDLKKGMLGFYIRIGFLMIPRFSLYLMINIMGFIGYLFFASIHGDTFITHPGSILLLLFLIFATFVFIFESIKIWSRKPTKHG